MSDNMYDYFVGDRLAEGLRSKVAIRYGQRSYTYDQIATRSSAVARALFHNGHRPEQRVLLILPDNPAYAWSLFGALLAGGVVAMGNPSAPQDQLEYLVDYTRATVIITTAAVAQALGEVAHSAAVFVVADVATGDDCEQDPDSNFGVALCTAMEQAASIDYCPPTIGRDDEAMWLFTSGSTGQPKAAVHRHGDFLFNTEVYAQNTMGYLQDDVTLSVSRLFFGYATGTNLFFPFSVGATVALFSERPTPEILMSKIAEYRPTVVTNVPSMIAKLLDYEEANPGASDFSSVRFMHSAGEALPQAVYERARASFGCEIYDGIGSAEMFHIYVTNRPGDVTPGSLGKPVHGYEVKLLAAEAEGPGAREVAPGEVGVMWVRGPSVAKEYFLARDKSDRTFFGPWCRTGDLFRRDENGNYWFEGRADDLFKVSGKFVAPLALEACLVSDPRVSAAVVVPKDCDGLTKPAAFVIRSSAGLAVDEAQLVESLQQRVRNDIAHFAYPRWVYFVDEMPKNDRGKFDRNALCEMAAGL